MFGSSINRLYCYWVFFLFSNLFSIFLSLARTLCYSYFLYVNVQRYFFNAGIIQSLPLRNTVPSYHITTDTTGLMPGLKLQRNFFVEYNKWANKKDNHYRFTWIREKKQKQKCKDTEGNSEDHYLKYWLKTESMVSTWMSCF